MPRLARLQHPGHKGHDAVGHPKHVDAVAPAPVVGLVLPDTAAATRPDASVVEQQVALAVHGEYLVGQRLHRGVIGHVSQDPRHPSRVGRRQGGHRGIHHVLLDVGHDHRGVGLQQGPDDPPPNAVGPTGHDGDRAGDLQRWGPAQAATSWVWFCGAMPGQPLAFSGISE